MRIVHRSLTSMDHEESDSGYTHMLLDCHAPLVHTVAEIIVLLELGCCLRCQFVAVIASDFEFNDESLGLSHVLAALLLAFWRHLGFFRVLTVRPLFTRNSSAFFLFAALANAHAARAGANGHNGNDDG